jgi:hypothetical protein
MRKFKFVSINIITVDIFLLNEKIILTTHLYLIYLILILLIFLRKIIEKSLIGEKTNF